MRYFYSIVFLATCIVSMLTSCSPSITQSGPPNTYIDSQYYNNISTLYGHGQKASVDSTKMRVAPDFQWKDSLGILHSLSELKGQVVVLNFWATWCTYCAYEMPDLQSTSTDFVGQEVNVIGISVDQGDAIFKSVESYVKYEQLTYQIVIDPKAYTYSAYGVRDALPTTYIIDRTGHIAIEMIGQQTKKKFTDAINSIL